jgi:predicted TIM-barrel fold metal-dependent hydrolase
MIGDAVVVDAVVHPYNLSPGNQNPAAQPQLDTVFAAHEISMDAEHAEYSMSRDEFFTDVGFEVIARSLFAEAPVDMAVIHALPNLGFANDYVTDPRRAAEYRDRHPDRFRLFATVDTPVTQAAIDQLEWQVKELGVDGLKLYPAFFYDGSGEGWRLDGEDFATPLLEAAHDLGIRHVAVHKALWLPPAPKSAFEMDDVGGALERFSDMTFQIVHAGTAFREETIELLVENPNLYATLETTFALIVVRPDVFGKVLGAMLAAVGSDRLLFASGTNLMHPRPLLEAFADYQIPEELIAEHGFPQLTEADRRNILGENVLRMHGIDPAAVRPAVAGDSFDEAAGDGFLPPWSALRDGLREKSA